MSRFFETIKIEDGSVQQPDLHQKRFDKTRHAHYENCPPLILQHEISIPPEFREGIIRCRIDYDDKIETITFSPYKISTHTRLRIIEAKEFDYSYKYSDRSFITAYLEKNQDCDDIIFTKDGFITDATYSNLVFLKEEKWFTPATCLLKGTKRTKLILQKKISEKSIHINDLINFEKIAFINAMRDFEKSYSFKKDQDFLTLNPAD